MMPNQSRLTPNQLRVLEALQRYFTEHQEAPTLKELKRLLETRSIRSVTQYLDALEKKGFIIRSAYQSRGIRLASDLPTGFTTVSLPLVGSAGCDNLSIFAEQPADEYVAVDRQFLHGCDPRRAVVVKAIGRSMLDAGINPGDMVITEITTDVRDGEKILAIIDQFAVIKKISFTENAVILNPMSPDPQYRPIVMREDFQISGRVLDVIRSSKNQPENVYDYNIKQ